MFNKNTKKWIKGTISTRARGAATWVGMNGGREVWEVEVNESSEDWGGGGMKFDWWFEDSEGHAVEIESLAEFAVACRGEESTREHGHWRRGGEHHWFLGVRWCFARGSAWESRVLRWLIWDLSKMSLGFDIVVGRTKFACETVKVVRPRWAEFGPFFLDNRHINF